jgi:uncharacterized protein YbcI
MSNPVATRGQAERALSQQIQALYRTQLGHQTGKVTCQILDGTLSIVIENSLTQPEKLLVADGNRTLAEQVRADLDSTMRSHVKVLVEEVLSVNVVDLLSDATLETGRTGMIVILENPPSVRTPASAKAGKRKPNPRPASQLEGQESQEAEDSEAEVDE